MFLNLVSSDFVLQYKLARWTALVEDWLWKRPSGSQFWHRDAVTELRPKPGVWRV
jgi:hypothetical protein